MFVTDAIILADLNATLKGRAATPTGAFWPQIVSLAHPSAYNLIFSRLIARGWTPMQIAAWDMGPTVERTISLYESLVQGGALEAVTADLLQRWESYVGGGKTKFEDSLLSNVLVTNANVWQKPQDTPGTCGTGGPNTQDDIFVWPPADGTAPLPALGKGRNTRW